MKTGFLGKRAFTIIELLVVVTILGILVLLAVPKILSHLEKAKLTHIQHDVKVAEGILTEYLMRNAEFPDEWPDVSKSKLVSLAANSELYDVTGYTGAEKIPEGVYMEVDKDYLIANMRTHLGGKFYVDEKKVKVYYEDDKPSKIIYKEDLFDREAKEEEIDQDKIKILGYIFPNGIYHNGDKMTGHVIVEGIESDDYYIEHNYTHSKFRSSIISDTVEFNLKGKEVKIISFDHLVRPQYTRGLYDFELIVKDSSDKELAKYTVEHSIYFAETEWVYYYDNDFEEIDREVMGQIGKLSSERIRYDYIEDELETKGIDYHSITFDVQPNSNESGQAKTILPETYGSYEAKIKVPDSDALLNGFFLYGHNANNAGVEHEIDIEILYDDDKWQVWGTVFNETHKDYVYNGIEPGVIYQSKLDLDFDPSEDYHIYRIDFYDDYISFSVDGEEFGRWENQFDYGDMHLYAGNFYTHWLSGKITDKELEMKIEWARKGYFK